MSKVLCNDFSIEVDCKTFSFFSFFCCFVIEISMCDALYFPANFH